MSRRFNVSIIGNGRIGQAIQYYLKKNNNIGKVNFFSKERELKDCDLLIGALPGGIGLRCLELALKYKKHLVDISDVEPKYYLRKRKEATKKNIAVIAGCGFCPGLVNFILGRELILADNVKEIEIKAGSLSPRKFFFPFLWCFEDLIAEHRLPSWQIISGKKIKLPPFCGFQKEKLLGIEAETYFSVSGFENFFNIIKANNITCRIIRPYGFKAFFSFLQNHGFFKKKNMDIAKTILENEKADNITLAKIIILTKNKKIIWQLMVFAKAKDKFNSMQQITASAPAAIGNLLLEKKLRPQGVMFMHDLARNEFIFSDILKKVKKSGVIITKNQYYAT